MRLGLIIVCLSGCGLVWDVESYRASDDASLDSGVDAALDAELDAGSDAGVDAGMDAGVDAGPDSGSDVGPDASELCIVETVEGGFDLDGPLTNTLVTHAGSGPAIQVTGPGVVIREVEIRITGSGWGIEVGALADDLTLEGVKVVRTLEAAPTMHQVRPALRVTGSVADRVERLTVTDFAVEGAVAVQLSHTLDAVLSFVRVSDMDMLGPANHGTQEHSAMYFVNTIDTRLETFSIVGPADNLTHALHFHVSEELEVIDGLITAPCQRYPVEMTGFRSSDPINELFDVDVSGSVRGVRVAEMAQDWLIENVKVVRSTCGAAVDDYAFEHTGDAGDGVSCLNCMQAGCATEPATLKLDADRTEDTSLRPDFTPDVCVTF